MGTSYGAASGFTPVKGAELTSVNGGGFIIPVLILGGSLLLSGCSQPYQSETLDNPNNRTSPK